MARARTIKPHFLRSRSMRRVSRDAQLTFIRLWLVADDAGRLRVSVHGLPSLYPDDKEAQRRIPEWLAELEREHCIERYTVDRCNYMRIVNWRKHQKISHPTPSRLPARPPGPATAPDLVSEQPLGSHSGATHEVLGSNGEKPSSGKGLAPVSEIPERFMSLRSRSGTESTNIVPSGLLGRFHERFMRKQFFSARGPLNAPSRDPLSAPSRGDAPRDRRP